MGVIKDISSNEDSCENDVRRVTRKKYTRLRIVRRIEAYSRWSYSCEQTYGHSRFSMGSKR